MQNFRRFGDHSFYDKFGKNGWPVYRECHIDYQRGLRLFLLIFVKLLKTFYMSTLFLNFLWHIMQTIFEESVVKHGQPFVNSELRLSSLDHGLELSIKVLGFLFYGRLLQYCAFKHLLVARDKNFLLVAILIIEHFSVKFLCVIFVVRLCFSHLKWRMIQVFCLVSWIFIMCWVLFNFSMRG